MKTNTVTYEIGLTQQGFLARVKLALGIIFKREMFFDVTKANIYHTNRNSQVSHIQL